MNLTRVWAVTYKEWREILVTGYFLPWLLCFL